MHNLSLLQDLFVIWISALIAGQLFLRLRLPPIAGYMMAGIAVGPNGLKLITDQEQIHVLAEFGVAMLLFALGVDLSLKQLKASAGKLILAGTSQLILTVLATALTAMALHLADSPGQAFLFGCVCAISSSVVISKILFDRGESDSVHGRILLSMAILQDLSLVLIIPFMPILAAHGNTSWGSILISAMKAIGFTALIFFGAMRALPSILAGVARSNSRELFLLTLLGLCLGIALLSHQVGLSIALGAFLAGIMISESLYAHQALHDVQPLKDLFSVVFFVSVGMLLDPAFIFSHCLEVVLFVILLISGKTVLAAISALFATANVRSALMVGAGMAQIGEFSFILLSMGRDLKMINDYMYNLFFAGAVVSLIASPALFAASPKLSHWLRFLGAFFKKNQNSEEEEGHDASRLAGRLKDHVIICGFGRVGRNLGTVLSSYGIPYLVIELNAGIIDDLAGRGIPHLYGDATSNMIMIKANLKEAACLVLTMPDPSAITAITRFVRSRKETISIIARAHRQADIAAFTACGVSAIVQPEFEASIEITRLALFSRRRAPEEIEAALEKVRAMRYPHPSPDFEAMDRAPLYMMLEEEQMGRWFLNVDDNMTGKSPKDLNVRGLTGVTITAIKRQEKTHTYPSPDFPFSPGDQIYAVGKKEELVRFQERFKMRQFSPVP